MARESQREHWEKLIYLGGEPETAVRRGGGGEREDSCVGSQAREDDPPRDRGTDPNCHSGSVFLSAAAREEGEENEDASGSSRLGFSSQAGEGEGRSRERERWQAQGRGARRFVLASNLPRFRPKGRRGMDIEVRRQQTALQWFRDSYNWMLKVGGG